MQFVCVFLRINCRKFEVLISQGSKAKVRWVLLYGSYSKFHTLSSSEMFFFENRLRFDKVTDS